MIAIVGAGAAGSLAAINLAAQGHDIMLIERNEKIMKKIYATGNGRCNFTNKEITIDHYRSQKKGFVDDLIHRYPNSEIIRIFDGFGILSKELENGKYFPLSLQARSIPQIFEALLEEYKVKIYLNTMVTKIKKKEHFCLESNHGLFYADEVIVATGGRAMAHSGSDGNGYGLLENMGHEITDLMPGIVQLRTKEKIPRKLSGAKYPGKISLFIQDKFIAEEESDILFTDYGISGPGILQLSSRALRALPNKVEIKLDNAMDLELRELQNFLYMMKSQYPHRRIDTVLRGIINNNLIDYILFRIPGNKKISEIANQDLHLLAGKIKNLKFTIIGPKSMDAGQITIGGVSVKEINEKTMESKLVPGLYIIGEIMDVDGDCGGYNLHWAFISALAATENIIMNKENNYV